MFVVQTIYEIVPASADRFRRTALAHARTTLGEEADCLRFDIAADEAMPGRFVFWQVFASKGSFDAHAASQHHDAFDRIVATWIRAKSVETYALISDVGT